MALLRNTKDKHAKRMELREAIYALEKKFHTSMYLMPICELVYGASPNRQTDLMTVKANCHLGPINSLLQKYIETHKASCGSMHANIYLYRWYACKPMHTSLQKV